MTNNKFKIGDRVGTDDGHAATIVEIQQVYIVHFGGPVNNTDEYSKDQLTLIDSIPEEPSNLPDDSVKGFNPEKLTFDGIEIKSGDDIAVYGHTHRQDTFEVVEFIYNDEPILSIEYYAHKKSGAERVMIPLYRLNITKHIPAKSELEALKEALDKHTKNMMRIYDKNDNLGLKRDLDRYYQARRRVEELESKNA